PDWLTAAQRVAGELPPSKEQTAAATGPGRAPRPEDIPVPPIAAKEAQVNEPAINGEADRRLLTEALAGLAPSVVPASPAMATTSKSGAAVAPAKVEPEATPPDTDSAGQSVAVSSAPAYERPNRVAITPDKLLAALQPKIEKAVETAILAAVSKHLSPALHAA